MRYRLVIFDFDGTLADSFPWFTRVFNGVADRYGSRRIQEEELDELRGLGGRELVRRLGVPSWKLPVIARRMGASPRRGRHHEAVEKRDLRRVAGLSGSCPLPGISPTVSQASQAGEGENDVCSAVHWCSPSPPASGGRGPG